MTPPLLGYAHDLAPLNRQFAKGQAAKASPRQIAMDRIETQLGMCNPSLDTQAVQCLGQAVAHSEITLRNRTQRPRVITRQHDRQAQHPRANKHCAATAAAYQHRHGLD